MRLGKAVGRVCPPWLREVREDLVQVAMIRVVESDRKSDGIRDLSSSYLLKVAYSALIDEIRRRRRKKEPELDEDHDQTRLGDHTPGPERHAAGAELGRAIQGCLAALIRPRRMAVALHLRGHGVPEVSELLGWNRTRAENLVYRGLRDLRRCLSEQGVAP